MGGLGGRRNINGEEQRMLCPYEHLVAKQISTESTAHSIGPQSHFEEQIIIHKNWSY